MHGRRAPIALLSLGLLAGCLRLAARSQDPAAKDRPVRDPAAEAVGAKPVAADRPEQKLTEHDKSDDVRPDEAGPAHPGPQGPAEGGPDHRVRLRPRPAQRREADADRSTRS